MPRGPNRNVEPMQQSWEADRAEVGGNATSGLTKGLEDLSLPSISCREATAAEME